jgi:lysophospholipase L1-like esterase
VEVVVVAGVLAVLGAAILLWMRWLGRRQQLWRGRLAGNIPVNSKYWRERAAETGELLYVAIGDSAAQGIGASRPGRSYVGQLVTRLRHPLRVVNLAISGATVRLAIESELPRLAKLEPDILTVCIGANDIADFDAGRFERDIRELFAALPAHAIVADLPSFYFLPAERKVREANRLLRAAAAEHGFTVVDLHARTRRQGLWGVSRQFAGDLFHPNDRGYRVWAEAFAPAVEKRLRELG